MQSCIIRSLNNQRDNNYLSKSVKKYEIWISNFNNPIVSSGLREPDVGGQQITDRKMVLSGIDESFLKISFLLF